MGLPDFGYMINPEYTNAYEKVKLANYQLKNVSKNATESDIDSLKKNQKNAYNIFEKTEVYKKTNKPKKDKFAIMNDARRMNKEVGAKHNGINLIA